MDEQVILTFFSFNEIFEKEVKKGKKYSEAYEDTEEYHEKKYGKRRYNTYDAFRKTRERVIIKKK